MQTMMSDFFKTIWKGLDDTLTIDFTIDRNTLDGTVSVSFGQGELSPQETLTISLDRFRPTEVRLRFTQGGYLRGYLQQIHFEQTDDHDLIRIFADIEFGNLASSPDPHHFEGIMAEYKRSSVSPPPPPEP
jgi:hypothetical protein